MVGIHIYLYLVISVNGDWIKLNHFNPNDLNILKTSTIPTILSTTEDYHNNTVIDVKNNNLKSGSSLDLVESTENNNEDQSSFFNSNVKDTLLGTYSILSQQDDNTLRGKLIFLQKVKLHLLYGIREHSKTLWNRRSSSSRSMFGYPSMEGALITIAFLTFAVFLIKIVQQFVQGLQGFSPNTVGFQLPMMVQQGTRIRRHLNTDEETVRIFHYMDQFKIHHEL